ncbi:MAG: hypothetical protein GY841_04960 [FCB group bacterium]|nr:hypothetical protein [FCB group bacterium]
MKRSITFLLMISVFIILTATVAIGAGIEYRGSASWSGFKDVEVEGNYAYCAMVNGLLILDISDPAAPDSVGTLYIQGSPESIVKSGNYLYIASTWQGLTIVDIATPATPAIIATHDTPGTALQVFLKDSLVYVADNTGGMQIVNVSIPAAPDSNGAYYSGSPIWHLFVIDTLAIVGAGDYPIIINVADPANPALIGPTIPPNGASVLSSFALDSQAFIPENTVGLHIVNIADPALPAALGTYETPGIRLVDVYVRDSLIYLLEESQLKIINAGNPAVPFEIESFGVSGNSLDIADTLAFIAADWGLYIINIADPAAPVLAGQYDASPLQAQAICAGDSFVYVGEWDGNLTIFNAAAADNPQLIDSFSVSGSITDIVIRNGLAFLGLMNTTNSFQVLDLAAPAAPVSLGQCPSGNSEAIFIQDTLAYAAAYRDIHIINISDSTQPDTIGNYYGSDMNANDLYVVDTLIYIADGDGFLRILNASDPTNPVMIYSNFDPITTARIIAVKDDHAYIGYSGGAFKVLDVSDPTAPTEAADTDLYGFTPMDVIIRENVVYFIDYDSGLQVLNIGNPAEPELLDSYDIPGSIGGFFVDDSLIYVGGRDALTILSNPYASGVVYCGEANSDGSLNIGDPVFVINYIFKDGPAPVPLCRGEANGDSSLNIGDVVYVINYIFKDGPPPITPCCP